MLDHCKPNLRDFCEPFLQLSEMWEALGDHDLAVQALDQTIVAMPFAKKTQPDLAAEMLAMIAERALADQQIAHAKQFADEAISFAEKMPPESNARAHALMALAVVCRDANDFDGADAAFTILRERYEKREAKNYSRKDAIDLSRFDHELGILRWKQNRYPEALALLQSAYGVYRSTLGSESRRAQSTKVLLDKLEQAVQKANSAKN